jgi:hypothetical protein
VGEVNLAKIGGREKKLPKEKKERDTYGQRDAQARNCRGSGKVGSLVSKGEVRGQRSEASGVPALAVPVPLPSGCSLCLSHPLRAKQDGSGLAGPRGPLSPKDQIPASSSTAPGHRGPEEPLRTACERAEES